MLPEEYLRKESFTVNCAASLINPYFVAGLATLLANDFILKYQYPGWITGKLSDFAGLYVFALFWISWLPGREKLILFSTALLFCFWKSSLSSSFISWLNASGIPSERVIDYTDLIALGILPIVYFQRLELQIEPSIIKHLAIYAVCILTIFSFAATTLPRNTIFIKKKYKTELDWEAISKKLDSLNVNYQVRFNSSGTMIDEDERHFHLNNVVYEQDTIREISFSVVKKRNHNIIDLYKVELKSEHYARIDNIRKAKRFYRRLVESRIIEEIDD